MRVTAHGRQHPPLAATRSRLWRPQQTGIGDLTKAHCFKQMEKSALLVTHGGQRMTNGVPTEGPLPKSVRTGFALSFQFSLAAIPPAPANMLQCSLDRSISGHAACTLKELPTHPR